MFERNFQNIFSDIEALFQMESGILDEVVEIRRAVVDGELEAEFLCRDRVKLRRILHTSPVRFLRSRDYFEKNCTTMLEFLRWYNLLDCRVLEKAITKYADGFLTQWQTNVHEFMSVSFFNKYRKLSLHFSF